MNSTKIAGIAFAIGTAAVIIWGQIRYQQGRDDMRAEMLALAPVKDSTETTIITHPRPDTMTGTPVKPAGSQPTLPVAGRPPAPPAVDTPGTEIIDESGGSDAMAMTYADTLTDTRGGSHALSFTYPSLVFREIYTAGADTAHTVTVTETKYVPVDAPAFWLTGQAGLYGAGASVGWKSVGVGYVWNADARSYPFISYTVRF